MEINVISFKEVQKLETVETSETGEEGETSEGGRVQLTCNKKAEGNHPGGNNKENYTNLKEKKFYQRLKAFPATILRRC